MTRTVATAGRRAPFLESVHLMRDRRISALPVIEDGGRVVGVVSDADLGPAEESRTSRTRNRTRRTGGRAVRPGHRWR